MNEVPVRPRRRRRGRVALVAAGASAAVLAVVAAVLPGIAHAATQTCSSQTSNSNGQYFQMWTAGQGSACITMNSYTNYSTQWSSIGDFVAGVGWNPGSTSRTINYQGNLSGNGGTGLMTLYGWSTNPLIEYYVIDNWIGSPNRAGTLMGQVTSDGGTYDIIKHQQVNQPSIQGTTTFWQYLAIRTSPRNGGGTITFSNFVNAWAQHGMTLGQMNYQIMATEAWGGGSGSSSVNIGGTVQTSGPPSSRPPSSAPPSSAPPSSAPPSSQSVSNGPGGCRATYSLVNSWPGGFQANVVVANTGSSPISGWTVNLTLAGGQTISSLWNGVNTGSSGSVSVRNAPYNGTVAGGGSTSFGYTGTGDGAGTPSNVSCNSS